MKKLFFLICFLTLAWAFNAEAATLYITMGGSGTRASGCLTSNPCPMTVAWINTPGNVAAGDTLLIKNGIQNCGSVGCLASGSGITISGKAGAPITLQCETFFPRTGSGPQCSMIGDGNSWIGYFNNASWWIVQGIHARNPDNKAQDHLDEGGGFVFSGGQNNIIRQNIIDGINTWASVHPILIYGVTTNCNTLIEENDILNYHRTAIDMINGTCPEGSRNFVRLNYVGHGMVREPHGGASMGPSDGLVDYNADNVTWENNIVEDNLSDEGCFAGWSTGARHLGDMAINCATWGFTYGPDGVYGVTYLNEFRDIVVLNSHYGINVDPMATGTSGWIIEGATAIGTTVGNAIFADARTDREPGLRSLRITNALDTNGSGLIFGHTGDYLTPATTHRLLEYSQSWGGSYTGASLSNTPPNPPGNVNPAMGSCVAYVPQASPFYQRGKSGADVGANASLLWVNGVRTTTTVFDFTLTGANRGKHKYGPGVKVGVNDTGNQRSNVHLRLGLGNGSCLSPGGNVIMTITSPNGGADFTTSSSSTVLQGTRNP